MLIDVRHVTVPEFAALAGDRVNPFLSAFVEPAADGPRCTATVALFDAAPHPRALHVVQCLEMLVAAREAAGETTRMSRPVIFQGDDIPVDHPSVSWERRTAWRDVALVPDLYYFLAHGYEADVAAPMPWAERRPAAIWRGSSTGIPGLTPESLDALPRYRLCRMGQALGPHADFRLVAITQTTNHDDDQRIKARVEAEGLMGEFVPMEAQARYKLLVDLDGNSNAWNAMAKLRLGCCMLRVDSDWEQWFFHRLRPWEHYVPVAADLADLGERIDWCLANDGEAGRIAAAGRRFAMEMSFADEMRAAAETVFGR